MFNSSPYLQIKLYILFQTNMAKFFNILYKKISYGAYRKPCPND